MFNNMKECSNSNVSIIILGASGHLARTKIVPGLFTLYKEKLLPKNFNIIGYARSDINLIDIIKPILLQSSSSSSSSNKEKNENNQKIEEFLKHLYYFKGKYNKIEDFQKLNEFISKNEIEKGFKIRNRMFFLALPPSVFFVSLKNLSKTCKISKQMIENEKDLFEKLNIKKDNNNNNNNNNKDNKDKEEIEKYSDNNNNNTCCNDDDEDDEDEEDIFSNNGEVKSKKKKKKLDEEPWNRVIIEKPFGRDLQSFYKLRKSVFEFFKKSEIYLIDHYIGKEVVQSLLALRFGNILFDPLWNRNSIQCIQIIIKESIGVQGRGGYFDKFGIIRDLVQNHMMQILSLVTMEPPTSLDYKDIVIEKLKVLKSIKPVSIKDCVLGQYVKKKNKPDSEEYPSYIDDPTVSNDSITPTFFSSCLKIRNRRWADVPVLFKCGKALNEKVVEIRILFNDVPANLYKYKNKTYPNELVIRIQPNESIYLNIMNKKVGYHSDLVQKTHLDFSYNSTTNKTKIPDAYSRCINDCCHGNKVNFVDDEELELSWKIWDPILKEIEKKRIIPEEYEFGSQGPIEAAYLAAKYDVKWGK